MSARPEHEPLPTARSDGAVLRVATRADIAAMHEVRLSVLENQLLSTIAPSDYVDHLERLGRGWLIELEGRVVAIAVGNATDGNIWGLFVHPQFERRGLGRWLFNTMVEWLAAQGVERLWLTTGPGTRAQHFYEAAGWQQVGTTRHGELRYELACGAPGSKAVA